MEPLTAVEVRNKYGAKADLVTQEKNRKHLVQEDPSIPGGELYLVEKAIRRMVFVWREGELCLSC